MDVHDTCLVFGPKFLLIFWAKTLLSHLYKKPMNIQNMQNPTWTFSHSYIICLSQIVRRSNGTSRSTYSLLWHRFYYFCVSYWWTSYSSRYNRCYGIWTSKTTTDDWFIEFVSVSSKVYVRSCDVFESRVIEQEAKLTLHTNKMIMRCKQFEIAVVQNKRKGLNLTYNNARFWM